MAPKVEVGAGTLGHHVHIRCLREGCTKDIEAGSTLVIAPTLRCRAFFLPQGHKLKVSNWAVWCSNRLKFN